MVADVELQALYAFIKRYLGTFMDDQTTIANRLRIGYRLTTQGSFMIVSHSR